MISIKPKVLFGLQHAWLKFGYKVLDLRSASWVIRRPEWLMQKPGEPKALEAELPLPAVPDTGVAQRLVSMYQRGIANYTADELIPSESIWGSHLQTDFGPMRAVIESGDVAALARHQAKLFRTKAVDGFAYGATFDSRPWRWNYLPVAIELSVVTLAEAVGILRTECHEQGHIAFWRKMFTEEQIIERLEEYFGVRLEQPRHGDPRGIMFGGRFLTRETCNHLCSAYRIRGIIDRQGLGSDLKIVEIGAGYGGTCYWLRKLLGDRVSRYVIVDLPEVGQVQAYFLGSSHPDSLVLPGEAIEGIASPIELVPHFRLDDIGFKPDVLINQDSMPEMPAAEVDRYLSWGNENVRSLFISFNQETLSPWAGTDQVFVPDIIKRYPRYRRIARELSWDRRGYVEETYDLQG